MTRYEKDACDGRVSACSRVFVSKLWNARRKEAKALARMGKAHARMRLLMGTAVVERPMASRTPRDMDPRLLDLDGPMH